MEKNISIPNGNEEVVVSLTVKELLALAGERFNQDRSNLIQARKKIRQQLEKKKQ